MPVSIEEDFPWNKSTHTFWLSQFNYQIISPLWARGHEIHNFLFYEFYDNWQSSSWEEVVYHGCTTTDADP